MDMIGSLVMPCFIFIDCFQIVLVFCFNSSFNLLSIDRACETYQPMISRQNLCFENIVSNIVANIALLIYIN